MLEREELQNLIDKTDKSPGEMRIIAESYMRGDVLRDYAAAEVWLQKVIESGDHKDSMIAMMLLSREILGVENPVSEEDYQAMCEDLAMSQGERKQRIQEMLFSLKKYKE